MQFLYVELGELFDYQTVCIGNSDKGGNQFLIINVVSVADKKNDHAVTTSKSFMSLLALRSMMKTQLPSQSVVKNHW